ncbi:hypothetical protein OTU49_012569, partial [Cherax quadricarinatus]
MRGRAVREAVREESVVEKVEDTVRRFPHHRQRRGQPLRRQRCSSLHSLLRQQLLTQGTKMAAAFRKLFRSSDKLEPQYHTTEASPTTTTTTTTTTSNNHINHNTCRDSSSRTSMNTAGNRSQLSGAWGQDTTGEGVVALVGGGGCIGAGSGDGGSAGGHNGLNSPSTARKFFSRHTYLEGSRVGPSEGVVSQHSPKSSSRGKTPLGASAPTSTGVLFKKASQGSSGAAGGSGGSGGGILNESTTKHMKIVRTRRLMKEFQELSRGQQNAKDPVFTVDLVNDCLYEWKVKLLRVDPDSELHRDMQEMNVHHILLSLSFPENFPFHPPFLRVLSPRLEK